MNYAHILHLHCRSFLVLVTMLLETMEEIPIYSEYISISSMVSKSVVVNTINIGKNPN